MTEENRNLDNLIFTAQDVEKYLDTDFPVQVDVQLVMLVAVALALAGRDGREMVFAVEGDAFPARLAAGKGVAQGRHVPALLCLLFLMIVQDVWKVKEYLCSIAAIFLAIMGVTDPDNAIRAGGASS